MNEIEKQLAEERNRMEEVKAPGELAGRLSAALEQEPVRRKRRLPRLAAVAAVLLLFTLAGYQYNAFAYYGKKLLGFDEVMTDTLARLNEAGNGQTVDRSVTLNDGTLLTVDGILADETQFVMYYTLSNPEGVEEDLMFYEITGFLTNTRAVSGTSYTNEEKTELKGLQTFEPVSAFAKHLTVTFQQANTEGEISFPFDPNQAVNTMFKQRIKKTVPVDRGFVRFDSITATALQTVVKGKMKVDNFDRIPLGFDGVQLLADGKAVEMKGSGITTSINGTTFEISYDALPGHTESLVLSFDSFAGYKKIVKSITLTEDRTVASAGGEEILIEKAQVTDEGLQLTVRTAENILLDGVSVTAGQENIPLETTLRQDDVTEDGKEYKERILLFRTDKLPDTLKIDGLHYEKAYGKTLKIL